MTQKQHAQESRSRSRIWAASLRQRCESESPDLLAKEQLGCGIVGDERYSSGGLPESPAVRPLARAGGLFLAAVELKLRHPTTGALLHVEIDEPPRFAALLDAHDGADVDSSGGGGA